MNRMIGAATLFTSSIKAFQSLLEFALDPRASLQQRQIQRPNATFFSCWGTSPSAMRSAKPSTTAVFPTPASPEDRVVLPPPRQNVDDLPDLEIAAEHRIDFAAFAFSVRLTVNWSKLGVFVGARSPQTPVERLLLRSSAPLCASSGVTSH